MKNVFKEFVLLFTANTDSLKKGAKEAEVITEKTEQNLKKSKESSEKLNDSLLKNITTFAKLASKGYAFNLLSSGVRNMIAEGQ